MASIFHQPTLWRGRGTYAVRKELRKLGARWSATENAWWVPPLLMAERQSAEQLRYRWRREIVVIPLVPGQEPPDLWGNLSKFPDLPDTIENSTRR